MVGGVFDFGLRGGGSGGLSILRFLGCERVGVVDEVFSGFMVRGWVDYFQIFGCERVGVTGGVFSEVGVARE